MSKYGDIVKSVDNAFYILETIMKNGEPMALKELAAVTHFPKSTIHGYLNTMRAHGAIAQADNGTYMLGTRMFEFGMSVFNSWDFVQMTNPILAKLTAKTGMSSMLSVMNIDYLMNVSYYPSTTSKILIAPYIGQSIPLHATAQGKVFLAGMEDKKIEKLIEIKGLKQYTENTITDINELFDEINKVRRLGVAYVNGEYKPGNQLISVPIKNKEGKTIYAISIMEKIDEERMSKDLKQYIKTLKYYASRVEKMDNIEFETRY